MDGDGPSASNQVIGDMLVLIGCLFYAISNTAQEYLVKKFDMIEFLAMLGSTGFVVSVIQAAILERDAISLIDWNGMYCTNTNK
jgi:solute carrier family 35 protein F1/2